MEIPIEILRDNLDEVLYVEFLKYTPYLDEVLYMENQKK